MNDGDAASRPVRAALVGYGLAGEVFHAPLVEATSGIEMGAVVTSDPARQERARAAHPGAAVVPDVSSLWPQVGRLGLELVVVAAPNRAHVSLAMAGLEARLSVVVDKPLATTAADARRVAAEADRRGLLLSVFHNRRWDGDFLTARRLVGEGVLGEVYRFESRYERWRPEVHVDAWRESADPADAGGLLFDLGSHLIDQAVVLFGSPVSVHAELDRRRAGAQVDDDAFVSLEHEGGVRSHLWMSAVASRPGPRFKVLGSRQGYEVWGMDPQEDALKNGLRPGRPDWGRVPESQWGTVGAGDDVRRVPTVPGNYGRFYEGLVASLRSGAPVPVPARDAIVTLEVIEAARRSAAIGGRVQLSFRRSQ